MTAGLVVRARGLVSGRVRLSYGLVLLFLSFAAGAPHAWGQGAAKADRFTVALWPEYDRPAVLVTYRVQLSPEVTLPARIDLPIPADVGTPHAVAKRGADGTLFLAPATREVRGEWAVMQVTTDRPQLQLEYYAPISTSDDERRFTFRWPGGLEIADLAYEVLPPVSASNVTVTPQPTGQTLTQLGVTLYTAKLGARTAGQQETISITYANPDGRLSAAPAPPTVSPPALVSSMDERPVTEPSREGPPDREKTSPGLVFAVVLGIGSLALIGFWIARRFK